MIRYYIVFVVCVDNLYDTHVVATCGGGSLATHTSYGDSWNIYEIPMAISKVQELKQWF